MELYLIRHAESSNNARRVEERRDDPPLTERGRRQADALASEIERLELDRLYTSPFLRTLETARPAAASIEGLAPEVMVDLHEYGGCFDGHDGGTIRGTAGLGRDAIRHSFPGFRVPEEIAPGGWWGCRPFETAAHTQERAERLARDTVERFAGTPERVGFLTHGTFTQFLVGALLGIPFHEKRWLGGVWNVAVTRIEIRPGTTTLHAYNSVAHLPRSLVTGPGNLIEGF